MIAFVAGVIAASTRAGSMLPVAASTSTSTGAAPTWTTGGRAGDERHRRRDDLIARPDPEAEQRQVQRRRAARHGDDVGDAEVVGELALEGVDLVAGREEQAVEHPPHRRLLGLAQGVPIELDLVRRLQARSSARSPRSPFSSVRRRWRSIRVGNVRRAELLRGACPSRVGAGGLRSPRRGGRHPCWSGSG